MRIRTIGLIVTLALGLLAAPLAAEAQQAGKVARIGWLVNGSPTPPSAPPHPLRAAFLQGLRDLGWVEGQNFTIEWRYAENQFDRLPALAAELVRLKPDVLVAGGTPAPLALKRATTTIPIVMAGSGDPLGTGLVASLAQPGGNVTGLSMRAPDLVGKRLELFKEAVPELSPLAVLYNPTNPYAVRAFRETERAARTLGVTFLSLEVRRVEDFESAFETAIREHSAALFTVEGPLTVDHRTRIADLTTKSRLPSMYGIRGFVSAGGLMSYGIDLRDLVRRAATYVDKILKGAKPADLPVEEPTKFDLVINLKTAKALNLTIPRSILIRADEIIE